MKSTASIAFIRSIIFFLNLLAISIIHGSSAPMTDEEINVSLLGQSLTTTNGLSFRQKLNKKSPATVAQAPKENATFTVQDISMTDVKANQEREALQKVARSLTTKQMKKMKKSLHQVVIADHISEWIGVNPGQIVLEYYKELLSEAWAKKNYAVGTSVKCTLPENRRSAVLTYDNKSMIILDKKNELHRFDRKTMEKLSTGSFKEKVETGENAKIREKLEDENNFPTSPFSLIPQTNLLVHKDGLKLKLRDVKTFELIQEIDIKNNVFMEFDRINPSPDGKKLLLKLCLPQEWRLGQGYNAECQGQFSLFDIESGKLLGAIDQVIDAQFLPDNTTILAFTHCKNTDSYHLKWFDGNTFKEIRTIPLVVDEAYRGYNEPSSMSTIKISPNGSHFIICPGKVWGGDYGAGSLYSAHTGELIFTFIGGPDFHFTPDGSLVFCRGAKGCNDSLLLFDTSSYDGKQSSRTLEMPEVEDPDKDPSALYSSDGLFVQLLSSDGVETISLDPSLALFIKMLKENKAAGKSNDLNQLAAQYHIDPELLFRTFDQLNLEDKNEIAKEYGFEPTGYYVPDQLIKAMNVFMRTHKKNINGEKIKELTAQLSDFSQRWKLRFELVMEPVYNHIKKISETCEFNEIFNREWHRKIKLLRAIIDNASSKND